jgi:mannose-1-phosphate guanylyltransferase
MMSMVDRPFVAHQIDHLVRAGVRDVIFSCGYRPDALESHFGDGRAFGVKLRYVVDPEPLGTAGAVKNAEEYIDADRFLVLNGDILTDLDLHAMLAQHQATGAVGTIALTPVEDPSAFGLVRLHDDNSVEEFLEKPSADELRPGEPYRINAGTYLMERSALEFIPAGQKVSIERETFPKITATGGLFGFPSESYWRDIGTPASYLDANVDVLAGVVVTESPTPGPYLGAGVSSGSGRIAVDACVGDATQVAADASISRSVVGTRVRVGQGAQIRGALIGDDVVIEPGASVLEGAVIGDGAVIGAGCEVGDSAIPTGAVVQPDGRVLAAS